MASAEIDAGIIKDAAVGLLVEVDAKREAYRKQRVREILKTPETTGPFWRRVIRHHTEDDAEVIFAGRQRHYGTREWWEDNQYRKVAARAEEIRNLAHTAIRDGRHVVRIDEEECALLKLPRSHFS